MNEIVWSNEALFKLSGTRNSHIFLYWCPESQRIRGEKAVNLPNGISSRGFIGPLFFKTQLQALRISACFGYQMCLPFSFIIGILKPSDNYIFNLLHKNPSHETYVRASDLRALVNSVMNLRFS